MAQKLLLTGIQPSGTLHLGNYIGALLNCKNNVEKFKKDGEVLFFVADLHSLTSKKDPELVKKATMDLIATYLASGINVADNCNFFIQSQVPQHCELNWIFTTICPLGLLERMTQFKDKKGKLSVEEINTGLLCYPILMAADILLYSATDVAVGEDQLQHMEFTRDIAQKFMHVYNCPDLFVLPQGLIGKENKRIMSLGDATKKMSKSVGEEKDRILLTDSDDEIAKKIKVAKTDAIMGIYYDKENRPEVSNLLNIMSSITHKSVEELSEKYKNTGTKVFKDDLTQVLIDELSGFREKFNEYRKDEENLLTILEKGREVASEKASKKMAEIRKIVGLIG